jgi:hypothetical protein
MARNNRILASYSIIKDISGKSERKINLSYCDDIVCRKCNFFLKNGYSMHKFRNFDSGP